MRNLRLALPVVGSALLVVVAACGATGTSAAPPGTAPTTQTHVMPSQTATGQDSPAQNSPAQADAVAIQNFAFAPATLTVPVGTTITWTNDDQDAHTVSASGGAFRSAALNHGDTFRFTFTRPGRYDYLCTIHPFMTATVVVTP